jgi:hypothetical protein
MRLDDKRLYDSHTSHQVFTVVHCSPDVLEAAGFQAEEFVVWVPSFSLRREYVWERNDTLIYSGTVQHITLSNKRKIPLGFGKGNVKITLK